MIEISQVYTSDGKHFLIIKYFGEYVRCYEASRRLTDEDIDYTALKDTGK